MRNIGQVAVAGRRTFLLRHGVLMPKWSFVTDPVACEALGASMAVVGRAERWSGLSAAEDRIWQAVLRGFTHSGRVPDAAWLADVTKLDEAAVVPLLRALRERDLLVLNGGMASVTAAYPACTCERPVRHRCPRHRGHVGCETVIESPSRRCGEPVRLATCDSGNALRRVAPSTAVVWSGIRYADDCSATSGCTAKAFFYSDRHLAAWRERTESGDTGFRLSIEAALQIGKAIFVPMLAGPATNLTKLQEDPNR